MGSADGAVTFRWGASKNWWRWRWQGHIGRLAGLGSILDPNVNQGIVGKQTAWAFGRCITMSWFLLDHVVQKNLKVRIDGVHQSFAQPRPRL